MALLYKSFNSQLIAFLLMAAAVSGVKAAEVPVGVHCPCEIVRINETKAEVSLSITFQSEGSASSDESGDLTLELIGAQGISIYGSSSYRLGEIDISSIPFSAAPVAIKVDVPLNYRSSIEAFFSILLRDSAGDLMDQVNFIQTAEEYSNYGGSSYLASSQLMINTEVDFQYDDTTFSLNIPSISSTDKRSSNDSLKLEIAVANSEGSYYSAALVNTVISYDENGDSSIVVSGDLNFSLESSNFSDEPEFEHVEVYLSRGEDFILYYRLATFGQDNKDSMAATWTNIDTLTDFDGDGVSDYNERILGSPVALESTLNNIIIEVAFTVGSSANAHFFGGDNLDASIVQQVEGANTAFKDVGLGIELVNVGTYILGDDSSLDGSAVLAASEARTGIFADLDSMLTRQPDLFVHLSTKAVADTGGIATLNGGLNDGIIDYKNLYSKGNNFAVVAIDNSSTTLVHEVGHLMGVSHSRKQAQGPITATFPWAVGYGINDNFTTIMAYESSFNDAFGMRFFSTPDRVCGGPNKTKSACGIDASDFINGAHSVKSLRVTALQISTVSNGLLPFVSVVGDDPLYISDANLASTLNAKAIDVEDGDISTSITFNLVKINSPLKDYDYEQHYSVTDSEGNIGTAFRKIIIIAEDTDTDGDGIFDYMDEDDDNDGVVDVSDAFPLDAAESNDTDSDGTGNNADTDDDNDTVLDGDDAFPLDAAESVDTDSDGTGNNADTDDDGDGVADGEDAFPLISLNGLTDSDSDGSPDECDAACIQLGMIADTDDDNDSVLDIDDAFPLDSTESVDTDSDGIGNNADTDDDNDTVLDVDDAFPLDATETVDTDSDGTGNNADTDDDGDGVADVSDAFPLNSTETIDTDSDGTGNNADTDDDGDGVEDSADVYPLNSLYSKDSDSDGMPDAWEVKYGLNPNDASDATSDQDNDGVAALDEFLAGTIPSGSLDIDGNDQYDALTDGLLLLRDMFGLDGSALVTGTIASDAAYTESADIEARISTLGDLADIDGNGQIDALTDGLLTLRYLFGLEGDTLVAGVVASDATRTTAPEIEAHLKTLMPSL